MTQPGTVHYLVEHDGALHACDSATAAVAALLGPGYAELDDSRALVARFSWAATQVARHQARLLIEATHDRRFDPTAEPEWVVNGFFTSKDEPVDVEVVEWRHEIPLVLVAEIYAPFTGRPLPTGNVVVASVRDEATFLRSLAATGIIKASAADVF